MRFIIPLVLALSIMLISCSVSETKTSKVVESQQTNESQAATLPAEQKIACYKDSDCGVRRAENAYCFQGNPVGDLYEWRCNNPGTPQANCEEIHKKGLIAECGSQYFCYKGECVKYANCTDSDNGLNYELKGKVTTNDFAVHEDYCKNSGTLVEYYCSSDDRAFSETKACNCDDGACV